MTVLSAIAGWFGADEFRPLAGCLTDDRAMIAALAATNWVLAWAYVAIGMVVFSNPSAGMRAMAKNREAYGSFIFLCGLSRIARGLTMSWGVYRLEAIIMGATATVSAIVAYQTVRELFPPTGSGRRRHGFA